MLDAVLGTWWSGSGGMWTLGGGICGAWVEAYVEPGWRYLDPGWRYMWTLGGGMWTLGGGICGPWVEVGSESDSPSLANWPGHAAGVEEGKWD